MRQPTVSHADHIFYGRVSLSSVDLPSNSVTDTTFSSATSARLTPDKQVQRFPVVYAHGEATNSASNAAVLAHVAHASGTLEAIDVVVDTAPTGDYACTVDLQKSTNSGNFASVLTAVVTVDANSSAKTAYSPTFSNSAYVVGDIFKTVLVATGSNGTQAAGLVSVAWLRENPA